MRTAFRSGERQVLHFARWVWGIGKPAENPIGMAWDQKGRMWVAALRCSTGPGGRLPGGPGWGRKGGNEGPDKVQMRTVILLFIPDADGDLVPDESGSMVSASVRGNYHNFANGLRWGPDGWLYGRCGHSCPGKPGVPGIPPGARSH